MSELKDRKWKLFNYMSRPQNSYWTLLRPPNQSIRAQKRQKWPQIKSNLNVRIQEIIENESCLSKWVDPKRVFDPPFEPQNSPLGPKKIQNNPRIQSKSNARIEGNKENKICCTIWVGPKTILTSHQPSNSIFLVKKSKKIPLN